MKYEFIEFYRSLFSVERMCRVLNVTRSSYYTFRRKYRQGLETKEDALLSQIKESHRKSRETYGSPRITKDLQASGTHCNRKKVAKLMRHNGIKARTTKKFKATTNSRHNLPVAANVLDREFLASAPDKAWVGDITYIWTREGWLYLAVVIDLYSRMVVGWSMGDKITAQLAVSALIAAIIKRKPAPGLLFHSDRGIQYACNVFKALLNKYGIIQSMSRKGNCYDNAVAESFFHTLKTEHVFFNEYKTRAEAKTSIFEYIEVFYNRKRRHSFINYQCPAQFETRAISPP